MSDQMQDEDEGTFICPTCGREFTRQEALNDHALAEHPDKGTT